MHDDHDVLELLKTTGALQTGHFELSSGRHSDRYCQCARLLEWPQYAEVAGRAIADRIDHNVEVVVGPAMGGIVIAHEVARAFGVRALFAERAPGGSFSLRRGFAIEPGMRVLVVEDVVTTGGSALEVVDLIRACGGIVHAIGCIVDRTNGSFNTGEHGVRLCGAVHIDAHSWSAGQCELCAADVSIAHPGSRVAGRVTTTV